MTHTFKLYNLLDIVDDYDVLLFDLWGVIVENQTLYPGVVEAINQIIDADRTKCFFVSNAPRPSVVSFDTIKSWGINVADAKHVFTSGEIARQLIKQNHYHKIFHLGEDRNHDILSNLDDVKAVSLEEAEAILLTLYRDEDEDLTVFDHTLQFIAQQNLPVFCGNPDTIIPNNGKLRYCSGYFAQIVEKLGQSVTYTGKPYIDIYNQVFDAAPRVDKKRILMIGDTLKTDILGAKNAGIRSALVLTGNASRHYADAKTLTHKLQLLTQAASAENIKPDFIVQISCNKGEDRTTRMSN